MKKIYNLIFTCLILMTVNQLIYSQINIDVDKYIQDPRVVGENKEPATTILIPFNNLEQGLTRDRNKSDYFKSLNGDWKFNFKINPYIVPADFYKAEYNDNDWNTIPVPSNWQMHGYDHQMYRNVPMEFQPYDPPFVPRDINPTGLYRTSFEIPQNWDGRKIFLHLDGVQSAGFFWLNGEYIGYHEDGMTAVEFDITNKIKKGTNTLASMVTRWCSGSYLEDQDMYRFAGIYRNVYLYSKPETTLRDLFIKTDFDVNYVNSDLILDFTLKNYSDKISQLKLRYKLFDADKKEVHSYSSDVFDVQGEFQKTITQKINSPKKWSDEKPYLYNLIIELVDQNNTVVEVLSQRVGFRELEVKDGIALMNGVPVYFRGANRHEIYPTTGKSLTKEMMIEEIRLLKQFNFNSVRTCHYPNDPEWYDLCDEYGILLQDEINAECHYAEDTFPKREDYIGSFMDRLIRMVQRDKNHPSVVMWSTGNECGLDKPHYMMADYIKKFDPHRFLMHQANRTDGTAPYSDIAGPRYPTPSRLRKFGLESKIPVVMGEYAHAMGNSLGHFDEFWETIYELPKLQGGFVWDWVDQGLEVTARFVKDLSPNQIQCGVMGRPEIIDGLNGKALKLSGLDDWVEVYDDPRLDLRNNNLVIEATIHPQKFYTENPIVTKAFQFGITQTNQDTLSFYVNSYKNAVKVKVPSNWYSAWHKVKGIYDGEKISLFIDEKEMGSIPYKRNINSSHYPVNVGRDSYKDGDGLLGWISNFIYDEVKIYDNVDVKNATPILWLTFDEITKGENYFSYGISPFCINGMITSDRKPQPELWQAKHSMSPVRFYSENPISGNFKAVNKFSFTNLNEFNYDWYLYKNGKLESSGKFELEAAPQSSKEFKLPLPKFNKEDGEYIIELSCKVKNPEPFLDKGFEINFKQFVIGKYSAKKSLPISDPERFTIKDTEKQLVISRDKNEYSIDKKTGALIISSGGKEMLNALNPNLWRAPISNEKFDWGKAEAEAWHKMGLNEQTYSLDKIEYKMIEDNSSVNVSVKSYTTFSRSSDYVENYFDYIFNGDGSIQLKHKVIPVGYFDVNWLPCIGLKFEMPDEYNQISWYGSGPYENYSDRNTGARIAIHNADVNSVMMPYIEPQEYGNYSNVKWFEIKNENGIGLHFAADKEINFSAVPYFNLDRAKYSYQLMKNGNVNVNLNYGITGVGDTPNPPMPRYRIYPEVYSNTVVISRISGKE